MIDKGAESGAQNDVNSDEIKKISLDPASNEGVVDATLDGNVNNDEEADVVMPESSVNDMLKNSANKGGKSNVTVLKSKPNSPVSGTKDIDTASKNADTKGGSLNATTPSSAPLSPLHGNDEIIGCRDGSKNADLESVHPGALTTGNDIDMDDATANKSAEVKQTVVSINSKNFDVLKSMQDAGHKIEPNVGNRPSPENPTLSRNAQKSTDSIGVLTTRTEREAEASLMSTSVMQTGSQFAPLKISLPYPDNISPGSLSPYARTPKAGDSQTCSAGKSRRAPKSQLEELYSPYILPGEQSLDDATRRLKTAIEQTRILREAFTERLYDKYRVVLRAVPKSSDPVLAAIDLNPRSAYQLIQQQMSVIQNEKDMEKIISNQINAELAAAKNIDETALILGGLTGVENAEQLSWFGAGLNLVILPEDDISDTELIDRGIKERAPIDPETGGKHRDLSAAAAVAAAAMLDRVRKGADIKRNRVRKPHTGTMGTDFSSLNTASGLLQNIPQQIPALTPQGKKGNRTDNHNTKAKISKSKSKSTSSLTSFLSMSPDVEGLRPNGKPSAVAYALMNNRLNNITSQAGKAIVFQHHVRHPFPQSKGARSMSYGHMVEGAPHQPFALPGISVANERRKKLEAIACEKTQKKEPLLSATLAVKKIVGSLVVEVINEKTELTGSSGQRRRFGLKRKASEIGVLLHNRLSKRSAVSSTPQMGFPRTKMNEEIDPLLAMSVMRDLGLIQKSSGDENAIDECITIDGMLKSGLTFIVSEGSLESLAIGKDSKNTTGNDKPLHIVKTTILDDILDPRQNLPEIVPEQTIKHNSTPLELCESVKKQKTKNAPLANSEIEPFSSVEKVVDTQAAGSQVNDNAAYVPSLRGGGGEDEEVTKNVSEPKDTNSVNGSNHVNSLPQDSTGMIAQQQQFHAMMAAGMITDQVPPGLYQHGNHQNGLAAAMNIGAMQNQGIQQHLNPQEQFHRHSFQSLGSAQIQNQIQLQQAALQSSQFLHTGGNDIGDYFNSMHQVMPQSYGPSNSAEWANLATQQNMLQGLPHGGIDPSSLGLSHQAAMLIRDRNAQVLLAREQQQLQVQVAAAQQNAAARMAMSQANFRVNHSNQYGNQPSHSNLMRSQSVPPHSAKSFGNDIVLQNISKEKIKFNDLVISPVEISKLRPSSAPPRSPTTETKHDLIPKKVNKKSGLLKDDSTKGAPKSVESVGKKASVKSKQDSCSTKSSNSMGTVNDEGNLSSSVNKERVNKEKTVLQSKSVEEVKPSGTNISKSVHLTSSKSGSRNYGLDAQPLSAPNTSTAHPLKALKEVPLASNTMGMKMIIPAISSLVSEEDAKTILKGHFYQTVKTTSKEDLSKNNNVDAKKDATLLINSALCEYLLKAGSAVPISKTMISNEVKVRLNTQSFQAVVNSLNSKVRPGASPCDVVSAAVTTWLWSHYQDTFKAAFVKNGRIDVDPGCTWLIKAAVEKATDENVAKGLKSIHSAVSTQIPSTDTSNRIRIQIAKLVSKEMSTGIRLNKSVNAAIPNFDSLVDHLDHLRMKALRYRCQERVLVASLISKRTRMSEAFSNAYTSSMIRAGAALGYDDLGEIVQDESTKSSSQMPFDILSDATGAWEDPCRSVGGYGSTLDSDELLKRAHARAMIQRSLKRLQDRHGIKGGTARAGPYSSSCDPSAHSSATSPAQRPSPRSGSKRKAFFSGGENLKNLNTAATTALFNPSHFSTPFIWDAYDIDNLPYGRYDTEPTERLRSPSGVGRHLLEEGNSIFKKQKISNDGDELVKDFLIQSTRAIDWTEVAQQFEDVKPIEKTSSGLRANDHDDHNVAVPLGSTIYAPFCRQIDPENLPSDAGTESEEENMDDEYILAQHQKVLNTIKDKFETMMKIRQEYQERSRRTSFGR